MTFTQQVIKLLKFKEVGGVVSLVIMIVIFGSLSHQFLTISNLATIFTLASELGIVTLGVNIVMIGGEFDMTVGAIFGLSPIMFEVLAVNGIPPLLSLLIVLVFAAAEGFFNGFVTTKGHIPSFIATLGMEWFWRGIILAITGGFTISLIKGEEIVNIFGKRLSPDIRVSSLWFIGLTILFIVLLDSTRIGNWIFASGGNPATADALGVVSWKVKSFTFLISGLTAAIAGLATFARFKVVDPTLGIGMELQAITAAVIGGTLMSGGYGSAIGAFLGSIILAVLSNGLISIGAPTYWYKAFIGLILIAAALTNIKIKKEVFGE